MSNVVNMSDYRSNLAAESANALRDGLVPVEFALGIKSREKCLSKISEYNVGSVHVRVVNDEPGALLYLIGVSDAIRLNKKIIETEDISDDEIKERIDLIQVMENMKFSLMDNLWESISSESGCQVH